MPIILPSDEPADHEAETLQYLADGFTMAQIARQQQLTTSAVRIRVRRLAHRLGLGATPSTHLVAEALRRGWIE